jgi:hypothetical protein
MTNSMNAHKKSQQTGRKPMILTNVSWIADELIGIRTLEERLSKRLSSRMPQNRRFLLNSIQDLNLRVAVLDRALDQYIQPRPAA